MTKQEIINHNADMITKAASLHTFWWSIGSTARANTHSATGTPSWNGIKTDPYYVESEEEHAARVNPPAPKYRPYRDISEVDRIGDVAEYRMPDYIVIGPVSVWSCDSEDREWFCIGNFTTSPKDAFEHANYISGERCGVKVEE